MTSASGRAPHAGGEPVEPARSPGVADVAVSEDVAGSAEAAGSTAARRADGGGLPEQTKDDTDLGWGRDPESMDAHDRWLLEQRPPHWD